MGTREALDRWLADTAWVVDIDPLSEDAVRSAPRKTPEEVIGVDQLVAFHAAVERGRSRMQACGIFPPDLPTAWHEASRRWLAETAEGGVTGSE